MLDANAPNSYSKFDDIFQILKRTFVSKDLVYYVFIISYFCSVVSTTMYRYVNSILNNKLVNILNCLISVCNGTKISGAAPGRIWQKNNSSLRMVYHNITRYNDNTNKNNS